MVPLQRKFSDANGRRVKKAMDVGVLKEIKQDEYRVALSPKGAAALVQAGHSVLVESNAGAGSGFPDEEYSKAGAKILSSPGEIASQCALVLKVKEPLEKEYAYFHASQMLFTYFHFASNRKLTDAMLERKVACIAYETVRGKSGGFPLLAPMSEVAGKMAPLVAANLLAKHAGGRGILVSGVGTVGERAKFVVLGSGVAGSNAGRLAAAMGADVTVITLRAESERSKFPSGVNVLESSPQLVEEHVKSADALVGAVYVAGSKAPMLVSRSLVSLMKKGSVIVDIAIDQGGCVETSHATTHANPTFMEEGVVHYCVANMPGAYPRTSTLGLTEATLPYVLELANKGVAALKGDEGFLAGLNCVNGVLCNGGVGKAHGMPFVSPSEALQRR